MPHCRARIRFAALGLFLTVLPAHGATGETIALTGASGPSGVSCPRAEGVFVAFLVPARGSLLLATQPFPGGSRVGTIEGNRLRFSVDGLGDYEFDTRSSAAEMLPVWGMMDRSLDIGKRKGCFSFGARDFSTVDDLKTYLHWAWRDLFFRLRSADNPEPLSLQIADRRVNLEISTPSHRPVTLQTREAGTVGLRLPDSTSVLYFQPFVLDEVDGTLAVKVLAKEEPFFGEGIAREVAFVTAGRVAPGMTQTDPVLEIRTAAIE